MGKRKEPLSATSGRELQLTRRLNAPVELVWEVFTTPQHIKNWWGPDGFTNTIHIMEVKPGGVWEFIMHGPDGTDYLNKDVFKEVVKNERIVFEHINEPKHITTITFTAEGKETLLNWHMLFESEEQLALVVQKIKAGEGLKQNVDKLEKYLVSNASSTPAGTLVITRVFNAPREVVFKAWTDPKQVEQWWSPQKFTNVVRRWNAKPGEEILVDMKGPDGITYPMGGAFHEVVEPSRIVFTTTAFKGADGKALLETLVTVTFEQLGGQTKLTLHVEVKKAAPGTEAALAGMEEGWSQSLDKFHAQVEADALIIERTYNAPVEKVWKALTNKEQMKQWYFDLPEFKPEVGFEFSFTGGPENRKYLHRCKITEVIPCKKMVHSWRYEGYEGNSFVSWELFDEGGKTRLKLTHTGLETFPKSNPDFVRTNFVQGWTHITGTSLKQFLTKAVD